MLPFLISSLFFFFCCPTLLAKENTTRWAVYYDDKASLDQFKPYDIIVFDSDSHPNVRLLRDQNKTLLGYISLGEVEESREWFQKAKDQGLLLEQNPIWKESYFVDLRKKEWTELVIQEIIPRILFKRFNGIFLDTIDNAQHLETSDPIKYKGMIQAAIDLIRTIRYQYPTIPIMLNRGFFIVPQVGDQINFLLAESLYTNYDFASKTFRLAEAQSYREQINQLKQFIRKFPKLQVFTLEYWNPQDEATVRSIYSMERKNGFIPYVSTIELNKVYHEPE